jgi:hypothetical protein
MHVIQSGIVANLSVLEIGNVNVANSDINPS